jgi:hypothetical protein
MKKYLQSYHAFFPRSYMKWIIYLVYPASMFALFFGGQLLFDMMVLMLMMPTVMLAVECMIDMFVFSGFAAKGNAGRMEYMMASAKGRGMVNRALAVDWIRRLLYLLVLAAVVYVASLAKQGGELDEMLIKVFFCVLTSAAFLMSVALWIIRVIDNRAVQYGVMYMLLSLPAWVIMLLTKQFEMDMKWICLVFIVLFVISVAGQIWFLMKKVKEGYYDA